MKHCCPSTGFFDPPFHRQTSTEKFDANRLRHISGILLPIGIWAWGHVGGVAITSIAPCPRRDAGAFRCVNGAGHHLPDRG